MGPRGVDSQPSFACFLHKLLFFVILYMFSYPKAWSRPRRRRGRRPHQFPTQPWDHCSAALLLLTLPVPLPTQVHFTVFEQKTHPKNSGHSRLGITFENQEKQAECAPPLPPSSQPSTPPKATPNKHNMRTTIKKTSLICGRSSLRTRFPKSRKSGRVPAHKKKCVPFPPPV